MVLEKQDQTQIKEREACKKELPEQKNVINPEQKQKKSVRRSSKKVRHCECVFLTKTSVLFRNLLTEEEVDQIHQLAARSIIEGWGSQQRRNFGKTGSKQETYSAVKTGGHTVTFLEEKFAKRLPLTYSFMTKVMQKIDVQTGWNVLKTVDQFNPRRMEFLQYSSKHKVLLKEKGREKKRDDGLGWHFDTDSLLTFICMCSHREDFEGGLLQIKVKQRKGGVRILTVPDFTKGDALVFLSERTEHRVTPTTDGVRCTFVYELWDQDRYDEGTDTSSGCESHSSSTSSSES